MHIGSMASRVKRSISMGTQACWPLKWRTQSTRAWTWFTLATRSKKWHGKYYKKNMFGCFYVYNDGITRISDDKLYFNSSQLRTPQPTAQSDLRSFSSTVKPPSVVWKHSAMSSSRFSFRRKRQPRWKPAAWLCSSLHFRLISFQIILLPVINMGVFTQKSVFKGHITVVRKNRTVVFLCLVESKRRGGETWDSCHYFQERQPCEI